MRFLPTMHSFDSLFDQMFNDSFFKKPREQMQMATDVKEVDNHYVLEMEVPGFKKEDIKLSLENGYLTVSATSTKEEEEKDDKGNMLRKERYTGSCSRSFYVGTEITEADINANYKDGELKVTIPKQDTKAIETKKYIQID